MKQVAKFLGIGKSGADSGGILNLISEKTGKISFRRTAAIVVLTTIVAPYVAINGLTWPAVALACVCLLCTSLDKILGR